MAFSKIAAENLGGSTLPALSGTNLTSISAGKIKQIVNESFGSVDTTTTSNMSYSTLKTVTDAITVTKGNKVLLIVTGLKVKNNTDQSSVFGRCQITDGTNTANTTSVTKAYGSYGEANYTHYSNILTTASGSGTVGVDISLALTSDGDTAYLNCNNDTYGLQGRYTCMEIEV